MRKIKRLDKKNDVETAFKREHKMRSLLTNTKTKNINQMLKNILYSVTCVSGDSYCEETSLPLR